MKKLSVRVIPIILMVSILSCKTKETTLNEMLDMFNANGVTVLQGSFQSAVHTTSGTVRVVTENNKRSLVFDNFKTDAGPDLRVYLATNTNATDFVELGTLKASNGSFAYEIDNSINLEQRSHVLIWCKRFSVLFGNAILTKK